MAIQIAPSVEVALNDSQATACPCTSTRAVRPDGVAIGLLYQLIWSRPVA